MTGLDLDAVRTAEARSATIGEAFGDLMSLHGAYPCVPADLARIETNAVLQMARRVQEHMYAAEAELRALCAPYVQTWERTEGRGKRGVGLAVITVERHPVGWRTTSNGLPAFEYCQHIMSAGPPPCPGPIVWRVTKLHRNMRYRVHWCERHLPAEHRQHVKAAA